MKNKRKAIILIIIFTILTLLDLGLTYYNTPDLKLEANPLVSVLGYGWGALIISNILTLVVFILLAYFSFYKYKTPVVIASDEKELKQKLDKTSGKGHFWAMLGYSLCYSLIISRSLVVFEWIMYTFGIRKNQLMGFSVVFFDGRFDLVIAMVLTFILCIVWMVKEEKHKKDIAVLEQPQEVVILESIEE